MPPFKNIVQGAFTPTALRTYLAGQALYFWGLIFVCWWNFPVAHDFSILTHTFSFLGSFNEDRNPEAWWLFTVAMCGWGLSAIPLVRYFHHSLGPATRKASRCMIVGCVGVFLVGSLPDARATILGPIRWTDLHYLAALILVLGFLIGIPWLATHIRRAARDPQRSDRERRAFRRAHWPHVFFMVESAVGLFFLIRWVFVYERLKAAAEAAGTEFGSPWSEAMNTIYSFPLWDNLFVYTLFIYFVWTALTLPVPQSARAVDSGCE